MNLIKLPIWQFFHGRFYDYRKTRDYKKGIRTVFSIEYEPPHGSLLSKDEVWRVPVVTFKIKCGWIMFNGWFPLGKPILSGYDIMEDYENS